MEIVPLGVGDAFSAHHYSSCLAVCADGKWLLVDCPHPIRKMLHDARAGVELGDVLAVALTHLHADHASGLEGYGYFSFFVHQRPARVIAHRDVRARLWDGHLAAGMEQLLRATGEITRHEFEDWFAWTEIAEDAPVVIGPFTIECRKTIHHIPTTAFRIRAGGRCLGYSADTAFDESLIAWLSAADLIVHETNLGVHTPYEKLAALPAELRARMRLIHYTDQFDTAKSVIEPLVEGKRVAV
jgi:ribonuclease BN (tRNA processing enzyme)